MSREHRIILHVDMDSFFASVEVSRRPVLAGKPVVVGADPKAGMGRGVVSTCSYEARTYGIHSAMPISKAYQNCPHAVFLPVNFPLYTAVSRNIMAILHHFGGTIQQVSIDEAFIDLTHLGSFAAAEQIALRIKAAVVREEGITCSVGVGPSRIVAKIASDWKKPDSLTVVRPEKVAGFLSPLPIRKIPGIGEKSGAILNAMGIESIAELAACRLVAVSGYGEESLPYPSPFDHHFQKPVNLAALLEYLSGLRARQTPPRLSMAVA